MRRLRPTDGNPAHKRAGQYHCTMVKTGKTPLHAELHDKMEQMVALLKMKARAHEDAEDAAVAASAISDAAEIALENTIRDVDADLAKLDREDGSLNARATVFPEGYGKEIDPEGESQLENLGALRDRLAKFDGHPIGTALLAKFDAARLTFKEAIDAEQAAEDAVEAAFREVLDARRAIREQLESAYGRLRDHYKARPAVAETFFLKEGRRRAAKEPTG
ncbi:hypothetical protein [Polyangium spumosum]|uniref:Uncharacterized protein n=1 Tax=Polyangium spumosum TaxID=889282 RepID=A0A6N7Q3Z5_9BACT|nr:hypothetical protein [Polyangium spumosum]MRG97580.1 hypothetical protein [Polyangium spumosum]